VAERSAERVSLAIFVPFIPTLLVARQPTTTASQRKQHGKKFSKNAEKKSKII
jgi:hypothetical protein